MAAWIPNCWFITCSAALLMMLPVPSRAEEADPKTVNEKIKEVAGAAEFLRTVPKQFAQLKAIDRARQRVTLLIEGDNLPKVWPLIPDAEIKVAGWWGRLEHLSVGDRVWVWFHLDRKKQPVAIAMLADELSEQDIHGAGAIVEAREGSRLTLKPAKGKARVVEADQAVVHQGQQPGSLDALKLGAVVFVQTAGDKARLILDPAAFEERRAQQKAALRKFWTEEGLPGAVAFLHTFGGEMDLMLDHEAIRWGRSLRLGDKVTLRKDPPIAAVVKHVRPWRERTALRLVVAGTDLADLSAGERVWLRMTPPAAEVDDSPLPPDLDQPRTKEERIEWFLASIYCTCKVKGDVCTGHFYTLASCNVNSCGMPNQMRKKVATLLDKGLTDEQVFQELLKDHGPDLIRPHLLP